jgi:hypothetical protein
MNEPQYLGDGVYAQWEGDMVKLTTEDGVSTTNTIYLEPQVYEALVRFVKNAENENP